MPENEKKIIIIKIKIKIKKKNETINLTKLLYKTAIFNLQKINRVLIYRVLLLSSKKLSPYRRVSAICKSFLPKMWLLIFFIEF